MTMITLKHLAQEFQLDPYKLRQVLRQHLPHKPNQRWQWKPTDPQLQKAKDIAKELSDETP